MQTKQQIIKDFLAELEKIGKLAGSDITVSRAVEILQIVIKD